MSFDILRENPNKGRGLVFISIENFNREFKGKYILSKELADSGFTVLLGHKSIVRRFIQNAEFKYSLYIEKGLKYGAIKLIQKLSKLNISVYSFDEEALMQTDFDTYLRYNHEKNLVPKMSGIFSWGPNHSSLLQYAGYQDSQVLKTGNPRFDNFIHKPFVTSKGKFILICSRFASANPANKGKVKNQRRDGSDKYVEDSVKVLQRMLSLPKELRENGVNIPIVVRPHPSESHSLWESAILGLPEVTISSKGDISDVVANASVLIHNRCTTGIQAYLSRTPVISYEPCILEEPPNPPLAFFEAFSLFTCQRSEDISSLIKCGKIMDVVSDNHIRGSTAFLYNIDKGASKAICKTLLSLEPHPYKSPILLLIYYCFFILKYTLSTSINGLFDLKGFRYRNKKSGFLRPRRLYHRTNQSHQIRLPYSSTLFLPRQPNNFNIDT